MGERSHDVVVWGASGFTGRLVAAYLLEQRARTPGLRLALGGRSRVKLEAVRGELARTMPEAAELPLLIADARDEASLRALATKAKVIATTVGPYRHLGEPLVAACAQVGTHYCDLTGEPPFVRAMIEAHDETARRSGARIVHCCGFDSIPSDLGVLLLQTFARETFGAPLQEIRMVTGALRGGLSGGTAASALLIAEEAARSPEVRRQLANPYLFVPARDGERARDPGQLGVHWDPEARRWTAPFVMAAINTRVVHRSNALLGDGYGHDFRYSEAMGVGRGMRGLVRAAGVTAALGGGLAAVATAPGRSLLRRILPHPGEGPPDAQRERGHFTLEFHGTGIDRRGAPVKARATVRGQSDPGYGETRKMLGESALCLALDAPQLTSRAGVLTPAAAMGSRLIERLRSAVMTFDVWNAS